MTKKEMKEMYDKLKKHLEDKDYEMQRWSNDIGELRVYSMVRDLLDELGHGYSDLYDFYDGEHKEDGKKAVIEEALEALKYMLEE